MYTTTSDLSRPTSGGPHRVDRWFDAHLDLACLAACGRDLGAALEAAGGPDLPASVTLPSLADGRVRACLGTIFTEADGTGPVSYPLGNAQAAHDAGVRQIEQYERWFESRQARRWGESRGARAICIGILMEGADPIRTPEELSWWVERGVLALGLTWARGSRYAGGNSNDDGLTAIGRDLILEADRLGVVHDISHLSDRALDGLLAATDRAVIASHSNCRRLIDPGAPAGLSPFQRHLTDEAIREVGRRGGVVGLNLFSRFLVPGGAPNQRATIDECAAHVEHVCAVMGHRRGVGLGSDMDGGFSAAHLPLGIDRPADLERLAEALFQRGWTAPEVQGFAWDNWARFLGFAEGESADDGPRTAARA